VVDCSLILERKNASMEVLDCDFICDLAYRGFPG
jgi:hypothetical protein